MTYRYNQCASIADVISSDAAFGGDVQFSNLFSSRGFRYEPCIRSSAFSETLEVKSNE